MNVMNSFAEKHPKAAEWVRKGGLFLIFSWAVTALKAVMLMFLPDLYRSMVGNAEWLWPNIPVALFGVQFNLAIIGNALAAGGLAYTLANLTAIFLGHSRIKSAKASTPARASSRKMCRLLSMGL